MDGVIRRKPKFGAYIDHERAGSLSHLLCESAGDWDEEESAIMLAIGELMPDEREVLLDVADGKELSAAGLTRFVAARKRLCDLLGNQQLAEHLITLSPRMYLRSFVVYYVNLRQLRSLVDYRAICTRATRFLGRRVRVEDLTDEFISRWMKTLKTSGPRKIANAIVRACRLVVFRETSNSTHPVFWTDRQRERHLSHICQLKGDIAGVPLSSFWCCFTLVASDLGMNLVDLRDVSKRGVMRQAARLSESTVNALKRMPTAEDEPLFSGLTRDRITRKHRHLCWASGVVTVELTEVELNIVRAVADGATTQEMRSRFDMTEYQLSHYRRRIERVRGAVTDDEHRCLIEQAMSRGLNKTKAPTAEQLESLSRRYVQAGDTLSRARIKAAEVFGISLRRAYGILGRSSAAAHSWDDLRDLYCRGPMQDMSEYMSRKVQVSLNRFENTVKPVAISDIDVGVLRQFAATVETTSYWQDEMCIVRRVLEFACEQGFVAAVPDFSVVGLTPRPHSIETNTNGQGLPESSVSPVRRMERQMTFDLG